MVLLHTVHSSSTSSFSFPIQTSSYDSDTDQSLWTWSPSKSPPISTFLASQMQLELMESRLRTGSKGEELKRVFRKRSSMLPGKPKTWAEMEIEKAKLRRERDIALEKEQKKKDRASRKAGSSSYKRANIPKPLFRTPCYNEPEEEEFSTTSGQLQVSVPSGKSRTGLHIRNKVGSLLSPNSQIHKASTVVSPHISPRTTMSMYTGRHRESVQTRRGTMALKISTLPYLESSLLATSITEDNAIASPTRSFRTIFTGTPSSILSKTRTPSPIDSAGRRIKIIFSSMKLKRSKSPLGTDNMSSPIQSDTPDANYKQKIFTQDVQSEIVSDLEPLRQIPLGPVVKNKTSSIAAPQQRHTVSETITSIIPENRSSISKEEPRRISAPTALSAQVLEFDLDTDFEREVELQGFRETNRAIFSPTFKRRPSAPRPSFDEPYGEQWKQHPGTPWIHYEEDEKMEGNHEFRRGRPRQRLESTRKRGSWHELWV